MSKICGIAGAGLGRQSLKSGLRTMTSSMKYYDWHRVDELVSDHAAFGHISIGAVNTEPQPLYCRDRSKSIIFCGKIFAYEARKRELQNKGYEFRLADNDAEFALAFYEEFGKDRLAELNGIFSFAIWDGVRKELTLVNDRYGMRPLYYYLDEVRKIFIFSSELKAISRSGLLNKSVNWDAWNVFLRLGFLIDDETFFKNVYFMPQASVIKFDMDRLRVENYWRYTDLKKVDAGNEDEYIDRLVFLYRQAIRRRADPEKRLAVFLSGGLDSSGISAELKDQDIGFVSYTTRKFAYSETDRRSAEYMAGLLKVRNEYCDLPGNFLQDYEPQKNRLIEYQSFEHAWFLPLLEKTDPQVKINLDGVGFDIMTDPDLYLDKNRPVNELLSSRNYEKFILSWYYSPAAYGFLRWPVNKEKTNWAFLLPHIRRNFPDEVFIEKIKKQLMRFEASSNQYIFFHLATRTRRSLSLAIYQIVGNKLESFCPYLDNDLFDYLMGLPVSVRENHTLRTKILKRAHPGIFDTKPAYSPDDGAFRQYHAEFYSQKLGYLSGAAASFLRDLRLDIFDARYMLPRIIKDIINTKLYYLSRDAQRRRRYYCACHYNLLLPLSMLNKWLVEEKI